MNLGKLIFGFLLLALIPAHWFLAGLTAATLGGWMGFLIIAFWIAILIAAVKLIYSGFTEETTIVVHHRDDTVRKDL